MRNRGRPGLDSRAALVSVAALLLGSASARGEPAPAESTAAVVTSSTFFSSDDGWFDLSGFLESRFGFLPLILPITEPAVGYGAAGVLTFIDKPLGAAQAGFGRPNITFVGGFGTQNGTWGTMAGDLRHWRGDRLQTLAGALYASVNLDFYGIGEDVTPDRRPIRYQLEPTGVLLQAKQRMGHTPAWVGLRYIFSTTQVAFDAPADIPGLPDYRSQSDVGGLTPSLTFDTRDNLFTPVSGTYAEAWGGAFAPAVGGDDTFQSVGLLAMQFIPWRASGLFLGLRAEGNASFGNPPFYMLPFVGMRGVPIMRYQGEAVAQVEAELRWQCWKRFSLVGFGGVGSASHSVERLGGKTAVEAGGVGFRYQLARRYGIHAGIDLAWGPDEAAIYFQTGSAWARP